METLTDTLIAAQSSAFGEHFHRLTFSLKGQLGNRTGVATGSPITLSAGVTVVPVTTVGTFSVFLPTGMAGTVSGDGTCNVTGQPVALTAGRTTIVTTGAAGNITFTLTATTPIVVEQDRFLHASGKKARQTAGVLFNNSDGYFTFLDLVGWQMVMEQGMRTSTGIEYVTLPPMWVVSQEYFSVAPSSRSSVSHLFCSMSLIGIPDRLKNDKADKTYKNHWSCTKKVKALLTEIADGQPVDTELTEEQTGTDGYFVNIYDATHSEAGIALTITNRTVTKLAFLLKKVGTPGGTTVEFRISQDAGGSTLASKTFLIADIPYTTGVWCEVTLTTPLLVNERVWLQMIYTAGDSSNYIAVKYNNGGLLKPNEALVFGSGGSPSEAWEDFSRDTVYRYKYTAGTSDTHGVDCFDHCTAYAVVYDSEDTLIDSYVPSDGFIIDEGSSRMDAIKSLLKYTGCDMRIESDGKPHVFVPVITGEVFDFSYRLED